MIKKIYFTFLVTICAVAEVSLALRLPGLPSEPSKNPPVGCPKQSSIFGGFCRKRCTLSCTRGRICCPKRGRTSCKFSCVRPVVTITIPTTTTTSTTRRPRPLICPRFHSSVLSHCTNGRIAGSRCRFSCREGRRLAGGIDEATCRPNGQWNEEIDRVRCVLSSCPKFHSSLQFHCPKGMSTWSPCLLTCPSTHTLEGGVNRTLCLPGRQWLPNVDHSRCIVKTTTTTTTEAPTTPPPRMCRGFHNSVMSNCTNGRVAGSECLFSCPAGQRMSPNIRVVMCKANGEWSSNRVRFLRCRNQPPVTSSLCPAIEAEPCPPTSSPRPLLKCLSPCPDGQICCRARCGGYTCTPIAGNPTDPPMPLECPATTPPFGSCDRRTPPTCEERCFKGQICCPNACGGRSCISIKRRPPTEPPGRCPITIQLCPTANSLLPDPVCPPTCPPGTKCCPAPCRGFTCRRVV